MGHHFWSIMLKNNNDQKSKVPTKFLASLATVLPAGLCEVLVMIDHLVMINIDIPTEFPVGNTLKPKNLAVLK